jgi:hypothetical protein
MQSQRRKGETVLAGTTGEFRVAYINIFRVAAAAVFIAAACTTTDAAVTRTPYQAYARQTCVSATGCQVDFPLVGANLRIEINSASCYMSGDFSQSSFTARARPDYLQLLVATTTANYVAGVLLVPKIVGVAAGNGVGPGTITYASSDHLFAFASSSQRIQILLYPLIGTFHSLACSISGEKVKLS